MVTVPLAEAKDHLSALVSDISSTHAHYTITRNGRAAVVMLPVDDLEALEETIFWLERELERLRAGAPDENGADISGAEMDEVIRSPAQRALAEVLAPSAAFAAWEFINGPLREAPRRVGKPLLAPLHGDWSARRGYLRVRYRVDDEKRVVTVVDIAHRSDAYHPRRVR